MDDLARILTEPKDALIKQYQVLFHYDGAKLEFTDEAIHEIARMAKARGTGARALRSIMENLMLDIMYDLPERAAGQTYIDHRPGRPRRGGSVQPERGVSAPARRAVAPHRLRLSCAWIRAIRTSTTYGFTM